jgi:RNA polymerase sigma-70 factor, ECF subfamily
VSEPVSPAELGNWIDEYTPRLLRVAEAFAAGPDEAQDLVQETWIIAMNKAHRRPANSPIGAWLHTVTLNLGRSRMRKRKRQESAWGFGPDWVSTSQHEPQKVEVDELRLRLWRSISNLADLQRRVLLLRFVERMSTAETAAALGKAEGTVKASLHRAIRNLRSDLQLRPDEVITDLYAQGSALE